MFAEQFNQSPQQSQIYLVLLEGFHAFNDKRFIDNECSQSANNFHAIARPFPIIFNPLQKLFR
jgi:hypothetical protein